VIGRVDGWHACHKSVLIISPSGGLRSPMILRSPEIALPKHFVTLGQMDFVFKA